MTKIEYRDEQNEEEDCMVFSETFLAKTGYYFVGESEVGQPVLGVKMADYDVAVTIHLHYDETSLLAAEALVRLIAKRIIIERGQN